MRLLEGKIAIITGGAKGIGVATSKKFAEHGASGIVVVDIDKEEENFAKELSRNTGCRCIAIKTDRQNCKLYRSIFIHEK